MSACGVYIMLNEACSHMVRRLMACCVTKWCRVPLGRAVRIALCLRRGWTCVGYQRLSGVIGVMGSITQGAGITPGALLCVNCWCSWGVVFNTHLAVGFLDFMMGSALVMWGIVIMGVSSLTLCSALCASCRLTLFTLYSSEIGGGINRLLIQVPRSLSKHFPLGGLLAWVVCLVNSSVRARRCWWGVNAGNWQSCRNNSVKPNKR